MSSPTRPATRTAIAAIGLRKAYGEKVVLGGVDLSIGEGEVFALLGPNGAGKTTTFYMVVGLVRPDDGSVLIVDRAGEHVDITHQPMNVRAREGLGYLAQESSVFRRLSVADNLRLIWEQRGVPRRDQDRRLTALLAEFDLQGLAEEKAETLSGGERRRVEIARAIATDPAFLLLDEPFTGVDPIAAFPRVGDPGKGRGGERPVAYQGGER